MLPQYSVGILCFVNPSAMKHMAMQAWDPSAAWRGCTGLENQGALLFAWMASRCGRGNSAMEHANCIGKGAHIAATSPNMGISNAPCAEKQPVTPVTPVTPGTPGTPVTLHARAVNTSPSCPIHTAVTAAAANGCRSKFVSLESGRRYWAPEGGGVRQYSAKTAGGTHVTGVAVQSGAEAGCVQHRSRQLWTSAAASRSQSGARVCHAVAAAHHSVHTMLLQAHHVPPAASQSLADHATACLKQAVAAAAESGAGPELVSPSTLVGLAEAMNAAGLRHPDAWKALGDLLLPATLHTAHTHPTTTSVSLSSSASSTPYFGRGPAGFTPAAPQSYAAQQPSLLSTTGAHVLYPSQIASVAYCFGVAAGAEAQCDSGRFGGAARNVFSNEGAAKSTEVRLTTCDMGVAGTGRVQGYHHVPLFKALAAAALAPAVHAEVPLAQRGQLPLVNSGLVPRTPVGQPPHTLLVQPPLTQAGQPSDTSLSQPPLTRLKQPPILQHGPLQPSPQELKSVAQGDWGSSHPQPATHRDANGRTALECMGLSGMSKLLAGFTAISHYDPLLWAAAAVDASTWLGAHTHSTLSILAQAVRRATSGGAPSLTRHPAQSQPQSYSALSSLTTPPILLLDLARLAGAIVHSGHLEAAPDTARLLLAAIAREAARQALATQSAAPAHASANKAANNTSTINTANNTSSSNTANNSSSHSNSDTRFMPSKDGCSEGKDGCSEGKDVCSEGKDGCSEGNAGNSSLTDDSGKPPTTAEDMSRFVETSSTTKFSANSSATSSTGPKTSSHTVSATSGHTLSPTSGHTLSPTSGHTLSPTSGQGTSPVGDDITAHSLVQLLSDLSSVGSCGALLLEASAGVLLRRINALNPQAQLTLLRVYAPVCSDISSGSTALVPPISSSLPSSPSPNKSSSSCMLTAQKRQAQQQHAHTHAQQVANVGQRQELVAALLGGPLTRAVVAQGFGPWELAEAAGRASAAAKNAPTPPSWPWPYSPSHPASSKHSGNCIGSKETEYTNNPVTSSRSSLMSTTQEGVGTAAAASADLHVGCHALLGAAGDVMTESLKGLSTAGGTSTDTSIGVDPACRGGGAAAGVHAIGTLDLHGGSAAASVCLISASEPHGGSAAASVCPEGALPPSPLDLSLPEPPLQLQLNPEGLGTVAAACDLVVSMARVGHHHSSLLDCLAYTLTHMHGSNIMETSPQLHSSNIAGPPPHTHDANNMGVLTHKPSLVSRTEGANAPFIASGKMQEPPDKFSLSSKDSSSNSSNPAFTSSPAAHDLTSTLGSPTFLPPRDVPTQSSDSKCPRTLHQTSQLAVLGVGTMAHTAAAYVRVGAAQAPHVCLMALQVLGLISSSSTADANSPHDSGSSSTSDPSFIPDPFGNDQNSTHYQSGPGRVGVPGHPHQPSGFLAKLLGMTEGDEWSDKSTGNNRSPSSSSGTHASLDLKSEAHQATVQRLVDTLPFHAQAELTWALVVVDPTAVLQHQQAEVSAPATLQHGVHPHLAAQSSAPATHQHGVHPHSAAQQQCRLPQEQQHSQQQNTQQAHNQTHAQQQQTTQQAHFQAHAQQQQATQRIQNGRRVLLRSTLSLYHAAAQAYQQQGTIQVTDPHVLLLAQAHIALMADLGNDFTEGLTSMPGLTSWSNLLQYAWEAHIRSQLWTSQQQLVHEVEQQKQNREAHRLHEEEAREAALVLGVQSTESGGNSSVDSNYLSPAREFAGARLHEDEGGSAHRVCNSRRSLNKGGTNTPNNRSTGDSLCSGFDGKAGVAWVPPSSVLLQHEVAEALQSPVLPDHHQRHQHQASQLQRQLSKQQQQQHQRQHHHNNSSVPEQRGQQDILPLFSTDPHMALAPGASRMVLDLEGFEVLVDVALLDIPGLQSLPSTHTHGSSTFRSDASSSEGPAPPPGGEGRIDNRVTALMCHGPDRFCYVHMPEPGRAWHETRPVLESQHCVRDWTSTSQQRDSLFRGHGQACTRSHEGQVDGRPHTDSPSKQQSEGHALGRVHSQQWPDARSLQAGVRVRGDALWVEGVLRRLGWRVLCVPYWEWPSSYGASVQGAAEQGDVHGSGLRSKESPDMHGLKARHVRPSIWQSAKQVATPVRPEVLHWARVAYLRQLLTG